MTRPKIVYFLAGKITSNPLIMLMCLLHSLVDTSVVLAWEGPHLLVINGLAYITSIVITDNSFMMEHEIFACSILTYYVKLSLWL